MSKRDPLICLQKDGRFAPVVVVLCSLQKGGRFAPVRSCCYLFLVSSKPLFLDASCTFSERRPLRGRCQLHLFRKASALRPYLVEIPSSPKNSRRRPLRGPSCGSQLSKRDPLICLQKGGRFAPVVVVICCLQKDGRFAPVVVVVIRAFKKAAASRS